MKTFKVNADTVAAILSREELEGEEKNSVQSLARNAFSSLGEDASGSLEITAYSNSGGLLIFAARKKRECFNITKWYPKVM